MAKAKSRKRAASKDQSQDAGIELKDITEAEWDRIEALAVQVYKSGQAGRRIVKASCMAFVEWMLKQDQLIRAPSDDTTCH